MEPGDIVKNVCEVFVEFKRFEILHILNVHPHSIERNTVIYELLHEPLHHLSAVQVSGDQMPAKSPLGSSDRFSNQVMVLLNDFCRRGSKHEVKVAYTSICLAVNTYLTERGIVFQCPLLCSCDVCVNTIPSSIVSLRHVEWLN
jgi:hypothetical protein